jgi:heme/copper-type cytochrome/quinol oxidase subunit 4
VLVAATVIAGLISGPINRTYATVQERASPQMLGRVFGALQSLAMAGIPVGNALTGFAVDGMGVTVTIMAMAVVYLAVTLGMFLRPALRQMDFQHQMTGLIAHLLLVLPLSSALWFANSRRALPREVPMISRRRSFPLIKRLDQRVTGKGADACRLSKVLPQI